MPTPIRHTVDQRPYFFDQGLRFGCRQCGGCCVGTHGTIYVSADEITTIGRHLGMTEDDFIHRYCYPFKQSFSIGEDSRGQCRFYNEGCAIYPVRPLQCRTFPFWFSNMRSKERWHRIMGACPGIGAGRLYTKDEIISIAQNTMHF